MKLNKTELTDKKTIEWLMKDNPSIRWQAMKDLPGKGIGLNTIMVLKKYS